MEEKGIYAFHDFTDAGGARFETADAMWDFLVANKGALSYSFRGTTVHARPDRKTYEEEGEAKKNKNVSKLVRILIENHGGDGATLKQTRLSAKYPQGIVRWKGDDDKWETVGEWRARSGMGSPSRTTIKQQEGKE